MARIVPSQVVAAIRQIYPWAQQELEKDLTSSHGLQPDQAANLAIVLRLLDSIPDELLPVDAADLVVIEAARGAMQGALASWTGSPNPGLAVRLTGSPVFEGRHPITAILRALRSCPDERADSTVSDLAFISDEQARQSIRADIATAHRAFGNSEFKAAAVLAGAVIEALLLYRIKAADDATIAKAVDSYDRTAKQQIGSKTPEEWGLAQYIGVASAARLISDTQAKACDLCREFRNLIHPGRILRTGADATRGSALQALAAMQLMQE